jgi:hypothetical protein
LAVVLADGATGRELARRGRAGKRQFIVAVDWEEIPPAMHQGVR